MEEYINLFTSFLANLLEIIAAFIIGLAALHSFYRYMLVLLKKEASSKAEIRLKLGSSLALGLEFLLGADILRTAVDPTWNELGILAAIAVLRTGLNYFLEKELQHNDRPAKKISVQQ